MMEPRERWLSGLGAALVALGWLPTFLNAGPEWDWTLGVGLVGALTVLGAFGLGLWRRRQR